MMLRFVRCVYGCGCSWGSGIGEGWYVVVELVGCGGIDGGCRIVVFCDVEWCLLVVGMLMAVVLVGDEVDGGDDGIDGDGLF